VKPGCWESSIRTTYEVLWTHVFRRKNVRSLQRDFLILELYCLLSEGPDIHFLSFECHDSRLNVSARLSRSRSDYNVLSVRQTRLLQLTMLLDTDISCTLQLDHCACTPRPDSPTALGPAGPSYDISISPSSSPEPWCRSTMQSTNSVSTPSSRSGFEMLDFQTLNSAQVCILTSHELTCIEDVD
jgi:hypothetical protein